MQHRRATDTAGEGWRGAARARRSAAVLGLLFFVGLVPAGPARAQEAWVRDEVQLNLRTGPGNQYRITGAIRTGDAVRILERGDGWTKVALSDGRDGWVPAGFLDEEPPATLRVARLEDRSQELEEIVDRLRDELASLRSERDSLADSESIQRTRAEQLEVENLELKAGARWPEWITGAAILATGMLVGSILQSWMSRRPRSRIKL
jgi:SH3 domain protein